jgi:GntR family transcriptional regulator/MocR family aminotransferase
MPDLSEYLLQHVDKTSSEPLNRQLYFRLRDAILRRVLNANARLPSSRELAHSLAVSRNTVLYAYEQLYAEGYIDTRVGDGSYVTDTMPDTGKCPARSISALPRPPAQLSARGQQLVDAASAAKQQWGAFMPGVPDVRLFPFRAWHAILSRVWRAPAPTMLTYTTGGGYEPLRQSVSDYLRIARSVDCDPSQVVITSGIHQSIDLCLRLLSDPGDRAWMEEPGYWGTRTLLAAAGLHIDAVPVDGEGMCVGRGQHRYRRPPKFIFVTPSHQYPLGAVMSLARRRALLDYANHNNCWVIEDDYDSEFRYEGMPLASLQGLDAHGKVIYTGTFSKTMFPGLRLGYLVLPRNLTAPFVTGMEELHRAGQVPLQAAVAEFMQQGHFQRHVRRMRIVYARRLALLERAIAQRLAHTGVAAAGSGAGLHITLHLPPGTDDRELARAAQAENIFVRPLSPYFHKAEHAVPGLVLGYACVSEEQIRPAFDRLADIILQHLPVLDIS